MSRLLLKSGFVLTATLFFTGCLSTYKGPGPDFSSKNPEVEIAKFTMTRPLLGNYVEMNDESYTESSVRPVMLDVSSAAHKQFSTGMRNELIAGLVGVAGVLAWQASYYSSVTEPMLLRSIGGGLFLSGLGFSIYAGFQKEDALDEYNRTLRSRMRRGKISSFGAPVLTYKLEL